MPLIDYLDIDDLDDDTRRTLSEIRNARGEIPAFTQLVANSSHVLKTILPQYGGLMYEGNVEPALKQLAFVVVSHVNRSPYCTATHGYSLVHQFGKPKGHLEAVARGDVSMFDEREQAVWAFARKVARDPQAVGREDVEDLRRTGFDDADIIELLAVVAQARFANTIVDAMRVHPVDEAPELESYYPGFDAPWPAPAAEAGP